MHRRNPAGGFLRILLLLVGLVIFGAIGFLFTADPNLPPGERWTFLDAIFMAVITLTTVGYGEVHKLSPDGKVFAIAYLILGFGLFGYGISQLAERVLHAQFRHWLGRRRMDTALKSMKDHFIICGFGRMGRTIAGQLAAKKLPFIAVDRSEEALADCQQENWPWLVGDATDDRTLLQAGLERAQGLAAVLPSESDNLYVVLSARLISRKIQIIARSSDEKGSAKLARAGANRVVNIYSTGAAKITQLLVNPNVEDFLEVITSRGKELGIAEIQIAPGSPYVGQTLAQTDLRKMGIIIVGIRRKSGELVLPPASTDIIQDGDCLIAIGRSEAVDELVQKA